VFALQAAVTEFRERSIFTFDPAKVKELKMVGWYETAKYLFTLVLERKSGGVWEAPSPPRSCSPNYGRLTRPTYRQRRSPRRPGRSA